MAMTILILIIILWIIHNFDVLCLEGKEYINKLKHNYIYEVGNYSNVNVSIFHNIYNKSITVHSIVRK